MVFWAQYITTWPGGWDAMQRIKAKSWKWGVNIIGKRDWGYVRGSASFSQPVVVLFGEGWHLHSNNTRWCYLLTHSFTEVSLLYSPVFANNRAKNSVKLCQSFSRSMKHLPEVHFKRWCTRSDDQIWTLRAAAFIVHFMELPCSKFKTYKSNSENVNIM